MASVTAASMDHRRGLLIASVGGLVMTFDAPLLRLAGVDVFTATFWRGVFVFTAMCGIWAFLRYVQRTPMPLLNGRDGVILAVLHCMANLLFMVALFNTTVANLVFILALNPLSAALFSLVWLRERIAPATWAAIFSGIIGVTIIVMDGAQVGSLFGDLAALGAVLVIGFGLTFVRRSGKNLTLAPGPGALLAACIVLPFTGSIAVPLDQLMFIAANGLIVMPFASAMLVTGPRYLTAAEVAMFFLLETVLAPIWVWLFLGEVPSTNSLIGGAIILITLGCHAAYRLSRRAPEHQH
ncbi:DMT family transporter [Rhodoligotrophos defluvii]|uniref:DMT family transporter n=1 Tax=Rhodoligotrophos defluvii TaxID=2561934 RepID=UPI0010C9BAAA|nr:DMT family transporter [Rhodoligotrophos defluvii]